MSENPFSYEPDSEVYLCNVPWDISQKNQLLISINGSGYTLEAQLNYFRNQAHYIYTDFTYQRKDGIIRVGANADVLRGTGINYCFFHNKHYMSASHPERQWTYCFVTKIEFLNESTSALHIKTDVFQTYFFDMAILPSFIEREHTVTDNLFEHTVNESITELEYTCIGKYNLHNEFNAATSAQFANNYWCGVLTSEPIRRAGAITFAIDNYMGGQPNPCIFYGVPLNNFLWFVNEINESGQAAAVVACVSVPKSICKYTSITDAPREIGILSDLYQDLTPPIGRPNQAMQSKTTGSLASGYTPRNKKCYCFPYNFLQIENNAGSKVILKYENCQLEDLSKYGLVGDIPFQEVPILSQNPNITLIPMNYEGEFTNLNYSVQTADFPPLPWNNDSFKNWYALHSNSITFGAIQDVAGTMLNLLSGNAMAALGSGMNMIGKSMSILDQAKAPANTRNSVLGNTLTYSNNAGIYYKHMCLKIEYLKIVDDYFTKYGYEVDDTHVPRLINRRNFDYIKTKNINIRFQHGWGQQINSGIPQEDMIELKNIFDNGVTLWHNPETYGDYFVDNSPV